MYKKFSILFICLFLINILFCILSNYSFASINVENKKRNSNSYWETTNAPLFYGTTKITIKKDIIDEFSILDSRFRIFATDFEDGDLTPKITYSGNVNINETGIYEITYKVIDSHNNQSTLIVPVIVTDDENAKITVERTLYTIPSVWNMDLAEFSRCNYGDRQILGIYLSSNQKIRARVLSSENNLKISFLNNDSYTESSTTLPSTGEWITLENKVNNNSYDSVPLISSIVLPKDNTKINKTFKIELEYDEHIEALSYYHYQDNEANFRTNWIQSGHKLSVLESETLIMVVPLIDINYMTNFYKNGFTSLDSFFDYYQKVVEKMDEYVGLDFNPIKITDQNVRTKYLIKANAHGVGAAYYAGDHVGVNNSSMKSFFEMNWGGLHELAHGYQGSLGKGEMLLGEVSNNILGHYIQTDKDIYFHPGNWLGELSSIEDSRNFQRLNGKKFTEVDEPTRLYMIINLLNTFEKGTTYSKMFSWYREQLNLGRIMTNQDAYAQSIADIYDINIIPYMEAWGLTISDETKSNIYQRNPSLINILKDFVSDESLNTIITNEGIDQKYSLVTNDILNKYDITSSITINIDIDDYSKLDGKFILIKDGNTIVKSIKIDSTSLLIDNLPIGTYYLQMPIIEGYNQDYTYVQVKEGIPLFYTHTYENQEDVDYNNYLKLQVLGYNYDTIAYQLVFKNNYKKAEISYPNQSGMSGNEYIKIYNNEGILITEDSSIGGYFDYSKGTHEIDLDVGYTIEVNYPNKYQSKIKIFSILTGNLLTEYSATNTITKYIVINNGLIKENMSQDEANDLAYEQLKPSLIAIIENYKSKVTDTELNNKFINFKEKSEVIEAYTRLRKDDQAPYTNLITSIKKGGSPIVTVKGEKFEYNLGDVIDLYSLVSAKDNEDGPIAINKNNTIIDTKLDTNIAGNYKVTYKVFDSDNNVTAKVIYIDIIDNSIPEIPDDNENTQPEQPKPQPPEEDEKPIEPDLPENGEDEKPVEPDLPEDGENEKPIEPDLPQEKPELPDEETPEEPNLPVEDEEAIPEEKPNLPENDTSSPEVNPDLPIENENVESDVKPVIPENNTSKPEKIPNSPVQNTNNETTINKEISSTLDNNIPKIEEILNEEFNNTNEVEVQEEKTHYDKEMITDNLAHATGFEELHSNSNIYSTLIKIIGIITSVSLIVFLIINKRSKQ